MRRIIQPFTIVERVLRDRIAYFAEIARGEALPAQDRRPGRHHGLGTGHLWLCRRPERAQPRSRRSSRPSSCRGVFLASGVICLPTLYYFSVLFGSRLRFMQTVTLILTAQTVAAVLAMGTAPISLLFLISGSEMPFLVALNIGVLALSAALGLIFLVQGVLYIQESKPPDKITFFTWAGMFVKGTLRSVVLAVWIVVYGLVGTQLSYTLRPFFGIPVAGNDFWSSLGSILAS